MTVPASSSDGIVVDKMRFAFTGGPFELRFGSMEIRAGEHVAIVGPSGCGKTTLLELIAGILVPDAGRVSADGCDWETLDEASRRRRRIERVGLVFQEFELLPHLSVLENIVLPMHLVPSLARGGETLELGRELARRAGLDDKLERHPGDLSQGERQRVAVCRAMVTRPSLILADEPTGNLDVRTGEAVLDLLVEGARERGATLLVVTHDPDQLGRFDRTIDLMEVRG